VAEGEVVAANDVPSAQAVDQHPLDEGTRGRAGEVQVERNDHQQLGTERFDQPLLDGERRQPERRRFRLEDAAGVRLQRQHRPRNAG
jgi:hypothetical protein